MFGRYRAWLEGRGAYPREWRKAAGESDFLLYLTDGELSALNEELVELLRGRYQERLTDPASRPAGARPVEMLMISYPIDADPGQTSR